MVAERAVVLSKCDPLPFSLDARSEVSEDLRLKYRYLDLRRPELQEKLILRHRITHEARRYFDEQGFLEVETPILTKSTPEGARDYLVPSRVHPGEFYALPQSPQLFKQLLMIAGFERYMQIARCFRDEDLRADRQPEFTQIDLEMSFPTEEIVYELIEGLFARVFPIVGIEPKPPFRRMTYAEAIARYGIDRPDLRFGLEIQDVTAAVADSPFRAFAEAAKSGGRGARPRHAGRRRHHPLADRPVGRDRQALRRCPACSPSAARTASSLFQVKNVLSAGQLEALAGGDRPGRGRPRGARRGQAGRRLGRARRAPPRPRPPVLA